MVTPFVAVNPNESVWLHEDFFAAKAWSHGFELTESGPGGEFGNAEIRYSTEAGVKGGFNIHDFKLVPKRQFADPCSLFQSFPFKSRVVGENPVITESTESFAGEEEKGRLIRPPSTFSDEAGGFQFLQALLGRLLFSLEIQRRGMGGCHGATFEEPAQ